MTDLDVPSELSDAPQSISASLPTAPPPPSANPASPFEEVRISATALIVLGVCELASIPLSLLTAGWLEWISILLASIFTAFLGVVTIMTGLSLRKMQNVGLTVVGLTLTCIPSLLWLIKLPFLALSFNAIRKANVRAAFQEIPWQQSDAWQQVTHCATSTQQAAAWSGGVIHRVGTQVFRPLKWLILNRKLRWSSLFVVWTSVWGLYAAGATAFAINVDEVALRAAGFAVSNSTAMKSWLIALMPFVLGLLVIGRHCQRRYRDAGEVLTARRAGLVDALLMLLIVALFASVSLSVLSHIGGFVFPEHLATAEATGTSSWFGASASHGLDLIYFSYALIAGIGIFLVWSGWLRMLTQGLIVITLVAVPIGSMAIAGSGASAPFYWSMLLPIWLSVPVGVWAIVNLVTDARTAKR